jgi:murein DD-endopeptidase MepM/ murein hydrolase activator NlpD
MMILIRLIDKICGLYYFILKHNKFLKRFLFEILIVTLLLFACYTPKEISETVILKSQFMVVEKDSINYLLRILEKKDSTNTSMLRHLPSLQPIRGKDIVAISTRYGMRVNNEYGMSRFHDGIDFAANRGTPIFADGDGVIIDSNFDNGYGHHVQIDHQNGYVSFYGHMNSRKVINGQTVSRGDTIGTVGSTGVSTGFHLHYKVSYNGTPVNPSIFK